MLSFSIGLQNIKLKLMMIPLIKTGIKIINKFYTQLKLINDINQIKNLLILKLR